MTPDPDGRLDSTAPGGKAALTPKDKFDASFRALSQYYTTFIDFGFKHGSLMALGLGWLITSSNAQNFFESHYPQNSPPRAPCCC